MPRGINSRGAAIKQNKNWSRALLAGDKFYIHCSGTEPSVIMNSTGLDPQYGKEEITIIGSNRPEGKYILAYPANPNSIPTSTFTVPKAIRLLWDMSEIKFAYCFEWSSGDPIFAQGGYQGLNAKETGFDRAIAPSKIRQFYYRQGDNFKVMPAKVAKML